MSSAVCGSDTSKSTVGETLGCVFLNWNADDDMYYSLSRRSVNSGHGGLSIAELL